MIAQGAVQLRLYLYSHPGRVLRLVGQIAVANQGLRSVCVSQLPVPLPLDQVLQMNWSLVDFTAKMKVPTFTYQVRRKYHIEFCCLFNYNSICEIGNEKALNFNALIKRTVAMPFLMQFHYKLFNLDDAPSS